MMCEALPGVSQDEKRLVDVKFMPANGDLSSDTEANYQARCSVCDILISISNPQEHLLECKLVKPFECLECTSSFNKEVNLKVHTLLEHSAKRSDSKSCTLCKRKFSRGSAFHCHVRQHELLEFITCKICQQEFEYESEFRRHTRQEHSQDGCVSEALICAKCGDILSHNELHLHAIKHNYQHQIEVAQKKKKKPQLKRKAQASKKHTCETCGKCFVRPKELERHLVVHTRSKRFTCDKCNCSFAHENGLRAHQKQRCQEAVQTEKGRISKTDCKLCGMEFFTKYNLLRHVRQRHLKGPPAPINPFVMDNQPETAVVMDPLERMVMRVADEVDDEWPAAMDALLDEDGMEYDSALDLDALTGGELAEQLFESRSLQPPPSTTGGEVLLVVPEQSLTCSACLHSLDSLEQLLRHFSDLSKSDPAHSEVQQICPVCNVSVIGGLFPDHLVHHGVRCQSALPMIRAPPPRRHCCPQCPKRFQKPVDLERHLRIHTGEKPFVCACGERFRLSSTLHRHEKVHRDDGDSLVACSICRKTFYSRHSLRTHMISHSSACNFCPLTFSSEEERNSHQAQQHGQQALPSTRSGGSLIAALPGALSTLARVSRPTGRRPLPLSSSSAFARLAMPRGSRPIIPIHPDPLAPLAPLPGPPPRPALPAPPRATPPSRLVHISAVPCEEGDDLNVQMRWGDGNSSPLPPPALPSVPAPLALPPPPRRILPPQPAPSAPVSFSVPEELLQSLDDENGVLLTRLEGGRVLAMHPQPTLSTAASARRLHVRAGRAPADNARQLTALRAAAFAPLHVEEGAGSCAVCDVIFSSREEAEVHAASEDHETAQLLAPLASRDARAASFVLPQRRSDDLVCKLCSNHFAGMQQLVAHIRREHERDHPKSLAPQPHHHTAPMH